MLQIRAFKQPHRHNGLGLWIEETRGKQLWVMVAPIQMRELKSEEMYQTDPIPDINLTMQAGQKLIDDLWDVGLRPSEGSGSAGSFAAQGKHLEDMRKLVFGIPQQNVKENRDDERTNRNQTEQDN